MRRWSRRSSRRPARRGRLVRSMRGPAAEPAAHGRARRHFCDRSVGAADQGAQDAEHLDRQAGGEDDRANGKTLHKRTPGRRGGAVIGDVDRSAGHALEARHDPACPEDDQTGEKCPGHPREQSRTPDARPRQRRDQDEEAREKRSRSRPRPRRSGNGRERTSWPREAERTSPEWEEGEHQTDQGR